METIDTVIDEDVDSVTLDNENNNIEVIGDIIENTEDFILQTNDNYLNQNIKIENDDSDDILEVIEEENDDTLEEKIDKDENNQELIDEINNHTEEPNNSSLDTNPDYDNENFKILSKYGENFSTKEYLTNPAIGRDDEIKQLIVTLLTPEKSAILVGKPGIGKTAIVEGLGYKIKNNQVPEALKGYTIFKLNTASLTGTMPGTNELKIQFIVDKLKNLDKVMIFIDEIHTLIGDAENTLDFANIFKPIIDRGSVKIIGATTKDEYERYILRDKAFVRRFQKIEVTEPTREEVIKIMMGTYPKFEKKMGLKLKYTDFIKENIMAFLVDATSEFKRVYESSVRYPDISLTILQQAFSHAAFENRKEVTIRDVRKALQTTKLIYPDVIKKELVRFNVVFKDVYLMETKQILKDEA